MKNAAKAFCLVAIVVVSLSLVFYIKDIFVQREFPPLDYKTNLPDFHYDWIDNCDDISVWTARENGKLTPDTVTVKEGSQGLNIANKIGVSAVGSMTKDFTSPDLDLSKRTIAFWIYTQCVGKTFLQLQFTFRMTDVTYSSRASRVMSSMSLENGWNYIRLDRSDFALTGVANWTNINRLYVAITAANSSVVANATIDDIRAYWEEYEPKVVFRFDDGSASAFTQAYSYLSKYQYRGVCAIPTASIDKTGFMTLAQCATLYNSGWDLGSHTVDHKYFLSNNTTPSQADYELQASQRWLLNNGFRNGARFFVPPGHEMNSTYALLVAKYYLGFAWWGRNQLHEYTYLDMLGNIATSSSVTSIRPYFESDDQVQMLVLDCMNWTSPSGYYSEAHIKKSIDTIAGKSVVQVIEWHDITNTTLFQDIVDYVHSQGYDVLTLSDLYDSLASNKKFPLTNSSSTSRVDGTLIAHGVGQSTTSVQLNINGALPKNSICNCRQPTVIAQNSMHFQTEFHRRQSPIDGFNTKVSTEAGWGTGLTGITNTTDSNWDSARARLRHMGVCEVYRETRI